MTPRAFDREFFSDMEDIVCQERLTIPVDIEQRKAFRVSIDGLRQAFAKDQQVINLFVGPDQAVENELTQGLNRRLDVGFTELVFCPLETDLIEFAELRNEDAVENDIRQFPGPQRHGFPWCQVLPAQILKQLQRRDLGDAVFQERRDVLTFGRVVGR